MDAAAPAAPAAVPIGHSHATRRRAIKEITLGVYVDNGDVYGPSLMVNALGGLLLLLEDSPQGWKLGVICWTLDHHSRKLVVSWIVCGLR